MKPSSSTNQPEGDHLIDALFSGLDEELPDDPWALLEGAGFEESNLDHVLHAVENDEDIETAQKLSRLKAEHVHEDAAEEVTDPWELLEGSELADTDLDRQLRAIEAEDERSILDDLKLPKRMHTRDKEIEELFDDELERQLVVLLKVRVHDACHRWGSWEARSKALRWIFCSLDDSMAENDFLSLRDVASPFNARIEVLQARIQYQLYRSSLPSRAPLPWMADEPPSVIEGELLRSGIEAGFGPVGGPSAVTLFRAAWLWPGNRVDLLKQQCEPVWNHQAGGYSISEVLASLVDYGYIGIANGFAYAICRNPELKAKGGTFSWSDAL
jgi:hypothetical protein